MADRSQNTMTALLTRERSILRNVYMWMTGGLALTGVVAFFVSTNASIMRVLLQNQMLFFGLIIGELVLVIYLSSRIMKMEATTATLIFVAYSALNGVTLSVNYNPEAARCSTQ